MKVKFDKPYAMVGAGNIAASIWKEVGLKSDSTYGFNIFKTESHNGGVTQRLVPEDIPYLIKLARVLAQVIADDGCLPLDVRHELEALVGSIDLLLDDQGSL